MLQLTHNKEMEAGHITRESDQLLVLSLPIVQLIQLQSNTATNISFACLKVNSSHHK